MSAMNGSTGCCALGESQFIDDVATRVVHTHAQTGRTEARKMVGDWWLLRRHGLRGLYTNCGLCVSRECLILN
jgi:hypothetical protein